MGGCMSDEVPVDIENSIKQYNKTGRPDYKSHSCIIKGAVEKITYTSIDTLKIKLYNNESVFEYDSKLYFNPFMEKFLQKDKEVIFVCISLPVPSNYIIIDMYSPTAKTIKSSIAGLGKNIVDGDIDEELRHDEELYELILFSNTLKHKRLCIDKKLTEGLYIVHNYYYTFYCEEDNILRNWYKVKEIKVE